MDNLALNQKKANFLSICLFFEWIVTIIVVLNNFSQIIILSSWILLGIISLITTSNKVYLKEKNNILKLWVIFIIFGLFTTTLSKLFSLFSNTSIVSYIEVFIIPGAITLYVASKCGYKYFFKIFEYFMLLCCILGIYEFITKNQFYKFLIISENAQYNFLNYGSVLNPNYRLTLFFYHPIYYSIFLDIFIIGLIFIPLKNKLLQFLGLVLGIINLILTQSRTGWIALIIIGFIYIVSRRKIRITKKNLFGMIALLLLGTIIVLVIKASSPEFFNYLGEIINTRISEVNQDTLSKGSGARLENLQLIKFMPNVYYDIFGGGYGYSNYLLFQHPASGGWTKAIDNQYLTNFLNFGLIGIVLNLILLVELIYASLKDKENQFLYLCLLVVFISGFFIDFLGQNSITYLLFILFGMLRQRRVKED